MQQERIIPLLLRTAHTLRRCQEEVGDRHGITLQQFNVLSILVGAERREEGPLPVMEIAARLVEPGAGITRFVRQLIGMGFIRTLVNPNDGRQQLCEITAAGREKLRKLAPDIGEVNRTVLLDLPPEVQDELCRGLRQILDNLCSKT